MDDTENAALLSFKDLATQFLGNTTDENYKSIVEDQINNY